MYEPIFAESEQLATELYKIINIPLFDNSVRIITSNIACSMALEHWDATRLILASGQLPSAVVVHRAQFEALVRSVWLLYSASDRNIEKLSITLSLETEQSAKNMPQVFEMMDAINKNAPPQAVDALNKFKENSWKALNSYAHAGLHPIRRHSEGYPTKLITDVTRNANGLAIISAMQATALGGLKSLQKQILELAAIYPKCMPPSLEVDRP